MSRYIVCEHAQGEPGWKRDRIGRLTGSRAADAFGKTAKGVWSAKRADYMMELALEIITDEPAPDIYVTREMAWGVDQEPHARLAYELETGNMALESGFFYLPDMAVGCSVDGMVEVEGKAGVLELKCPKSTTHLKYLRAGGVPIDYYYQCLHNIWLTGSSFCDFGSYDPRFPENLQLFWVRFTPKPEELTEYEGMVKAFLKELDEMVSDILALSSKKKP